MYYDGAMYVSEALARISTFLGSIENVDFEIKLYVKISFPLGYQRWFSIFSYENWQRSKIQQVFYMILRKIHAGVPDTGL